MISKDDVKLPLLDSGMLAYHWLLNLGKFVRWLVLMLIINVYSS